MWSHRNKTKLGEPVLPIDKFHDAILNFLQNFRLSRRQPQGIPPIKKKVWIPPKTGEFKVNLDGAMLDECEKAGIGIVVRNSIGEIIAVLSEKST